MNGSNFNRSKNVKISLLIGAIFVIGLLLIQETRSLLYPPAPGHDAIAWQENFEEAAQISQRRNCPILIDFHAAWCSPCQWMEGYVWSDPVVAKEIAGHFVPLSADLEKPAGQQLALHYKVQYLPTILIVYSDGKTISGVMTMDKNQMLEFLVEGTNMFTHPATSR
jgi:thiol:disulfide interchange protein